MTFPQDGDDGQADPAQAERQRLGDGNRDIPLRASVIIPPGEGRAREIPVGVNGYSIRTRKGPMGAVEGVEGDVPGSQGLASLRECSL